MLNTQKHLLDGINAAVCVCVFLSLTRCLGDSKVTQTTDLYSSGDLSLPPDRSSDELLTLNPVREIGDQCSSVARNSSIECLSHPCYNGNCTISTMALPGFSARVPVSACICDQGWVGDYCDHCCDLDCHNGSCYVDYRSDSMNCSCDDGYMGTFCQYIRPSTTPTTIGETPSWYWYVVGVGLGAVGLLIISLVLIPYYLWRKRNILVMRIVRYFQKPESKDDGKLYDAYLSYSQNALGDERFAVRMVYPRLERQLGFKLFIPSKDTLPSHCRQDTIDTGIEQSRRTILLISPEYLTDEWARQELLTAQWEMLARRHCIIPVILRDISSVPDLDPVLKNIMKSVPGLVWPADEDSRKEEKFWKTLELLMPKLSREQTTETNNRTGRSCLVILKAINLYEVESRL